MGHFVFVAVGHLVSLRILTDGLTGLGPLHCLGAGLFVEMSTILSGIGLDVPNPEKHSPQRYSHLAAPLITSIAFNHFCPLL